MERHGCPVPGSLLGRREPLCAAAPPGEGDAGRAGGQWGSQGGGKGSGLAGRAERCWAGAMWLRGMVGLRGCLGGLQERWDVRVEVG